MRERESERPPEPYWQDDFPVDFTEVAHHPGTEVRFKVHTETYPYKGNDPLLRLSRTKGTRTWFRGSLYLPEYDDKAIGAASTAFYPAPDRTLVTWECFVGDRYQSFPPAEDSLLQAMFRSWEGFVSGKCPDARRLVIPSWEPTYTPAHWREFLESQGYRALTEHTFGKEVGRP
jgi:hypothetical protein